ncbi:MAG: A/G-specific adenine glycosylase [Oscillospiraceae bacterium]|nr:A/G-specific adenine glycosylase [Oscillospiraceae bacterium]
MDQPLSQLPIPLLRWYAENARDLPWRRDPTPYHVWLSEIMLQQTRVQAVLGYYGRFLQVCPTAAHLAQLPEDRLLKLWQGLGYYSRARSMQKAAQILVERYGGRLPADYRALLALPGVGEYTAGAIASIAFGLPCPAVDGNVLRVTARLTGDFTDISTPAMKKKTAAQIREILPVEAPGQFNQALMELGATVCLPNGAPRCGDCPARELCLARRRGQTGLLPVKAPRKPRRVEEREVFLIFYEGRAALRRRPERGLLAGLWKFPNHLSPAPCPVAGRETEQALGRHIFTHVEWHMRARVILAQGPKLPQGWIWAGKRALEGEYPIPSAFDCFRPVVEHNLQEEEPV